MDFDTGREVEARPAQRASNEPPDPLVGKELGGCRVKSLLGKGGMARVYLATQVDLEREVAVKVLSERLTRDPDQVEQFMREAKTLARLEHPNIVGVYSVGREEEPSLHYLVMQLVRGGSLKDVLTQRKRLEPDVACAYGAQIARGLHEAERAGVVHRDIKPGNILVAGDTLKITDFGLARMLDDPTLAFGQVVGTPHYMSPEQADSRAVDHRTDIYGLGATLYHLLVGEPPFSGGSIQEILLKHVNEEPVPPHKRLEGIPEGISRIVLRMLAKSPDARYASFREVVEALEAPTRGATQLPPPPEPLPAFLFDEQLPELAVDAVALRRERPLAFRLAPAALLAITCLVVGQGLGVVREVFADDSQQDTSALPPAERLAAAALQQLEPTLPALSRPEARRRLAALAEEHAGTEAAKAAAKRAAELKVAIDEAALAEVRKAIVAARDAEARGDLAAASKLLEGLDAEQRKLIGAADVEAFAAKIRAGLAARGVAYVPGGEFVIGFRDTSRRVRLDGFFIGLREVTADEYAELLAAQPDQPAPRGWDGRRPPVGKGNLPVTGVTLAQAEAYARWRGLRLPNYLEWEAAARGADGRRWPWGNDRRPKACNWSGRGLRGVRPPGSMPEDRSAWGCEDMAGNVAELACAPPGEAPEPWVCGGSYLTPLLEGAQGFFRRRVAADAAHEAVGFRLAGYPQPGGGGGR